MTLFFRSALSSMALMASVVSVSLIAPTAYAQVSRLELAEITEAFEKTFQSPLREKGEELTINEPLANLDWFESPIVNASYVQRERDGKIVHILTIMGGMLGLEGFTQDSAVLVLCHELGHGIGGEPLKSESPFSDYPTSAEAQADYYSTLECAPKVWKNLHPEKRIDASVDQGRCEARFSDSEAANACRRSFEAMKGFREFQKAILHLPEPSRFDSFDPSVAQVLRTDLEYYPSPQCRLDTLMNGALQLPRPSCWFPPSLN